MAYRRELWHIIGGSEVRFMWNITPLGPEWQCMSHGHIVTGLCDTMVPSAITWTPIYGRLGDRGLGTVILCISFVD
jgi:hypothetical protein